MIGRVVRRWVVATMDWCHITAFEKQPPEGLRFIRFGIWVKPNGAPQFTGDRPATGWEGIAILHKADIPMRWNGGGRDSVFNVPRENAVLHSTQKPIKLIRQFVELFTNPGDLILDPFCGSGTTGVACVELGRRFIGFEIDPATAELARERIVNTQPPLFVLDAAPAQMAMAALEVTT